MKTINPQRILLLVGCAVFFSVPVNSQLLKKLGKRAERAAERTIERRVDKETSEKTDEVLDSILEPGKKGQKTPQTPNPPNTPNPSGGNQDQSNSGNDSDVNSGPKTIQVYSKFDFVPGDKQLFFDDFGNEFIGDFPSKWNTNGGGEVVTLSDVPGKWYAVTNRSLTIPNLSNGLPEDYTIEFDVKAVGITNKTSSGARLGIYLAETPNLTTNESYAYSALNFCQYIAIGVQVDNRFKGNPSPISNRLSRDLRQVYQDVVHVSIAVNKNRYRLWINESKITDLPQFIYQPELIKYLKFKVDGMDLETKNERVLISNLKISEGGVDLRRKLISEGKISTNGILFDSGSANLKPESMGIIRQIYQVLQQDSSINLKIVGHTDADGSDEANLSLSKSRADAVKSALVNVYNVDDARLSTEGKGELEPVADNSSSEGKAQNRRVEFIKQ
ncbi:OmpA family protein [Croceivirga thetidis]|uniref:OmpA family protein n=1 Tax=Croceivirga thetidis TaxID=2721623 RepID=A0ABX1GPL7_9FLAO|nr:OmpA family protein [Croceivirga thetidis]NKI31852.1 OmpA family protein [Croceivirga thetidis]